jgi:hypothetical protein
VLVTATGRQIADMLCRGDLLRGYLSLCIRDKRVKRGDCPLGLITDMATAHYGCVGLPFLCWCAGALLQQPPSEQLLSKCVAVDCGWVVHACSDLTVAEEGRAGSRRCDSPRVFLHVCSPLLGAPGVSTAVCVQCLAHSSDFPVAAHTSVAAGQQIHGCCGFVRFCWLCLQVWAGACCLSTHCIVVWAVLGASH